MTSENLQNAAAEKCRKDDTLSKKAKGKQSIGKGTFDQHVADDQAEARDDGDSCDGVIGAEGVDTEANRRSRHRSFRTVVRTEFINTTINNSHTGQETCDLNNESLVAPFQRFLPLIGTQEPLGLSSG